MLPDFKHTSLTKKYMLAALLLGLGCLAYGWFRVGYWGVGVFCLGLLVFSLSPWARKARASLGWVLSLTILAAGVGLWVHVSLSLALLAVVCVLAAFDLDGFSYRLAFAAPEDDPLAVERRHLGQVNLALLLAVGLNFLSQLIRFQFGFEWTLLLAILAFLGIAALINAMNPAAR